MSANPEEDWHERLGLCSAGKIVVFAMHTELAVLGHTLPSESSKFTGSFGHDSRRRNAFREIGRRFSL